MRPIIRWLPIIVVVSTAVVACDQKIVEPSLSAVTKPITPPTVYRKWWAQTEACSGLKGDFSKIKWYDTPETTIYVDGEAATAYWSSGSNRIVVTQRVELDGQIVRHEMLHALVKGKGHPPDQFLGKCRGVVHCDFGCVPQQDLFPFPTWMRMPPESLSVNVLLDPSQPSMAIDSGFFQVVVEVTNTKSYPVFVVLPQQYVGVPPRSFATTFNGPFGGPSDFRGAVDYSAVAFQGGEKKREVFDYSLSGTQQQARLREGRYRIFGKYGSVTVGPITVDLPGS